MAKCKLTVTTSFSLVDFLELNPAYLLMDVRGDFLKINYFKGADDENVHKEHENHEGCDSST